MRSLVMPRFIIGAVVACLVAGCGPSVTAAPRASSATSATARPSASTLASQAATTPSASARSAPTCRLPVLVPTESGSTEPPGGWVTFPGGQFERDSSSRVAATNHLPSYDWPLHKWIPVESVNLSPDGTQYILDEQPGAIGTLYLVDASTGARRLIYSTTDYRRVVSYTSKGIYLTDSGINPSPGLWLLDPVTGAIRELPGSDQDPNWMLVGTDAAWTVTGIPGVSGQTVLRLDLATGAVSTWYQSPLPVGLLAVSDQGYPLITLLGDTVRVGLLVANGHFNELQFPQGSDSAGSAYAGGSQIWLPLQRGRGVALYTGPTEVQAFSTETGPYSFTVAGSCS